MPFEKLGEQYLDQILNFYVDGDEKLTLKNVALEKGVSLSEHLRETYLKRELVVRSELNDVINIKDMGRSIKRYIEENDEENLSLEISHLIIWLESQIKNCKESR